MTPNEQGNFRLSKPVVAILTIVLVALLAIFLMEFYRTPVAGQETFWLWRTFGRLHPMVVHFPIGLLLFTMLLELVLPEATRRNFRPAIRLLLLGGVLAAAFSVIFGLFLSIDGDYGKDLLAIHQWTGIGTLVLSLLAFYLYDKSADGHPKWGYRSVLLFTTIALVVAGHYGATLAHGKDYLSATLPWSEDYDGSSVSLAGIDINDTAKLTPKQELEIQVKVRAVFAHNCYKCHGPDKVKGDLRLDAKSFVFKGGEKGPVIHPGQVDKSELFRRITLPDGHKEAMPSEGKRLSEGDVAVIRYWIQKGAPWPDGGDNKNIFRVAPLPPRNPALPAAVAGMVNPVDRWTNRYFTTQKIEWPESVDDRTYLTRVNQDIIGLPPTPEELDAFLKDSGADKRERKVKELLNRSDDYATHWLTFWNDLLRNDYTGTGYITGGRFAITEWLYNALRSNMSYDRFAKELISPSERSKGFIEGIKWRGVVNASQRTEMQAAQNVSQVFLGLNLKCTSCHNSFISDWKLEDAYAFANIFSDSLLEINRCDKPTGRYIGARMLWKELGPIDSAAKKKEKLAQLADIMVKPENGRFYRTIVNRIWSQMMGRGIVEPLDMMDNEPWDQDLLDWLAYDFQAKGSDLRALIYMIATSNTYQLPSVAMASANDIVTRNYKFKGALKKRMSAEQFSDAVGMLAEPLFPDSTAMFKPVRDPGYDSTAHLNTRAALVANNHFLTALGRPNRETVMPRRESQANLLQALELTNGDRLNATLKKGAEKWKQRYGKGDLIIQEVYRRALGRKPKDKEYAVAMKTLGNDPSVESIQDLLWSVVLMPEFQIIN